MIGFAKDQQDAKAIDWRGSALNDLRSFPEQARGIAGKELRKVQFGEEPSDFKVISNWGAGVCEIRLNAWRVAYIAKFEDMIYVLHCFTKKSQKTSREDVLIIRTRYSEVVSERARRKNDREN